MAEGGEQGRTAPAPARACEIARARAPLSLPPLQHARVRNARAPQLPASLTMARVWGEGECAVGMREHGRSRETGVKVFFVARRRCFFDLPSLPPLHSGLESPALAAHAGTRCTSTHTLSHIHTMRRPAPPRPPLPAATPSTTPTPTKHLVVAGSINSDLVLRVDRLPDPGETLAAHSLATFTGGKGCNQAAAAARLGHPTLMVGRVGADAAGAGLVAALESTGCDTRHVRRAAAGTPTGTAVILLQPSGENSIIIVGGANTDDVGAWTRASVREDALSSLPNAGALLLQREVSDATNTALAAAAAAAGVPVLLDLGGIDTPPPPALLACVHTISPNETELARVTGARVGGGEAGAADGGAVQAAAEALLAMGPHAVLVKRGSRGAMLVTRKGGKSDATVTVTTIPAFPVTRVVDTTGAGDCFTGAYAVAMLRGLEAADAMRYAAAAAAVCVTREGALPSLPTGDEVEGVVRGEVRL